MTFLEIGEEMNKCIDPETGEFDEERYNELQGERDDKLERMGCFGKWCDAMIAALREEKKNIDADIESYQNRKESMLAFADSQLQGEKFVTEKCKFTYRKSYSTGILNEAAVPEEYFDVKVERKVSKKRILEDLKAGKAVEGCELLEKNNLSVR